MVNHNQPKSEPKEFFDEVDDIDDSKTVSNPFFDGGKIQEDFTEISQLKQKYDVLSKKLEKQIQTVEKLEDKVKHQMVEISGMKSQMFGVVGFLITIFTFISAATNFYTPILTLVKQMADNILQNGFNCVEVILGIVFLFLPIMFIGFTFYFARTFFKGIVR